MTELTASQIAPLPFLSNWYDDLLRRYPSPDTTCAVLSQPNLPDVLNEIMVNGVAKNHQSFRVYNDEQRTHKLDPIKEFYRLNHRNQTYEFVLQKEREFLSFDKREMSVIEALEYLNTLVDSSDPDLDLTQLQHLLQTSEAIRKDNHPDWFVLTGLLHDLGKILCLFGEPQWAVVGDTFPVGCEFAKSIVHSEFFRENENTKNPQLSSKYGVYTPHCGLSQVHMSWGHDEYLYHVLKDYLCDEALYVIRYHSFYAQHRENAYSHLMNEKDEKMFEWVKLFNRYDLYSKSPDSIDEVALMPYYNELIAKYLPAKLKF